MTKLVKLFLILLTIVSFSSGVVNLAVMFISHHPQNNLVLGIVSMMVSWMINQDIIDDDEMKSEINEYDETF